MNVRSEIILGPERPTLVETIVDRISSFFRLHYVGGCILFASIMGAPGFLLFVYLDTLNLNTAVDSLLTFNGKRAAWVGVIDVVLITFIVFIALYMIRYMRSKVKSAESKLVAVSPEGERSLHRAFGPISDRLPQLISAILLFLVSAPLSLLEAAPFRPEPRNVASFLLSFGISSLFFLTVGTLVWVYARSLWGLHLMGKEPLKLKPFYEDPVLGVGTIGSLSFSLTLAYYVVFGLVAVESLIVSPDLAGFAVIPYISFGALMFFLPLRSIHKQMIEEKRHRVALFWEELGGIFGASHNPGMESPKTVEAQLEKILRIETLGIKEHLLSEIPTWPFDKRTLQDFAALLSAVVGVVSILRALGPAQ